MDDIRQLTAELAEDPTSLVFLRLAEALRGRGQLDAARRVAVAGLQRHPELADAHDLLGRIHGDQRDFERAFDEWDIALRLAPDHAGAHKGIGFLYYVAGDLARAAEHLERAAQALPADEGVRAALARVTAGLGAVPGAAPPGPAAVPPTRPARAGDGMVIADHRGQRLGGLLVASDGTDLSDAVAAAMQGVAREAERASEMLGLGRWTGLSTEAVSGGLSMVPVSAGTVLMLAREREIPLARLGGLARRAADEARAWLAEGE